MKFWLQISSLHFYFCQRATHQTRGIKIHNWMHIQAKFSCGGATEGFGQPAHELISSVLNGDLDVHTQSNLYSSIINWSKEKGIILHQFDELPVICSSLIAPYIHSLLIPVTFIFNDEDYEDVEWVLHEKGVADEALHYYYNNKYWKECIRMATPSAE